jgi:hypothetical protein
LRTIMLATVFTFYHAFLQSCLLALVARSLEVYAMNVPDNSDSLDYHPFVEACNTNKDHVLISLMVEIYPSMFEVLYGGDLS